MNLCRVAGRTGSRSWAIFLPGVAAAILRLALIPALGIPQPYVHDEFSFLLGADTLAHGRLTNPAHPHWRFFETIHELSIPTYASKYPPGQALFLAVGQILFGHPWWGVVLGFVFFVTATTWMLRAWVPPAFALLGGTLTAINFGTGHYWLDSYWGGAVAAGGCALVLGAAGRIAAGIGRERRVTAAWPFATGAILLWCTRPFEGGCFVLGVCALLARDALPRRAGFRSFAAVLAVCLALTIAAQAYLDWRVTGDALTLPYEKHIAEYSIAPALWIQPLRTPTLETNAQIHRQHAVSEMRNYNKRRAGVEGWANWVRDTLDTLNDNLPLVPGAVAVLSLLLWKDRVVRELWFLLLVAAIPLSLETWVHLHYMSALVVLLTALLFRLLWRCRSLRLRGYRAGYAISGLLLCAIFALSLWGNVQNAWLMKQEPVAFVTARSDVTHELLAQDGMHVVFVRYRPSHDVEEEWVYNSADIDAQRIVWARDLGDDRNIELIRYYSGRHFWILDADADHPRLSAYGLLPR